MTFVSGLAFSPLTSISGYAEIIESGIVAPEDIERFAGKIHKESGRLLSLIGDIIELSELDVQIILIIAFVMTIFPKFWIIF